MPRLASGIPGYVREPHGLSRTLGPQSRQLPSMACHAPVGTAHDEHCGAVTDVSPHPASDKARTQNGPVRAHRSRDTDIGRLPRSMYEPRPPPRVGSRAPSSGSHSPHMDLNTALGKIIEEYNTVINVMGSTSKEQVRDEGRAWGGFLRATKGKLQEHITESIVRAAFLHILKVPDSRLKINSDKIDVRIDETYVRELRDARVREYIQSRLPSYVYGLSVDKHIFVDNRFVAGIECKAYTENAMIKRILVDFMLLRKSYPDLRCFLFQLESQLGGDYSSLPAIAFGSQPTHTLMSYFRNVNLQIITLLEGERRVDEPIDRPNHFKPLKIEHLRRAAEAFAVAIEPVLKT